MEECNKNSMRALLLCSNFLTPLITVWSAIDSPLGRSGYFKGANDFRMNFVLGPAATFPFYALFSLCDS